MDLMKKLRKLRKIANNAILCIRFPFLYPRNRFTGNHYDCWKIVEFHRKWWRHTSDPIIINITTDTTKDLSIAADFTGGNYMIRVDKDNNVRVFSTRNNLVLDLGNVGTGKVIRFGWENRKIPTIVVDKDFKQNPDFNRVHEIIHSKWLRYLIRFLDWINDWPLQIFHCAPTYTELDDMPDGWRKAFGIQMCKDIRRALIKRGGLKLLFKYRIMQIKEKYGTLRWYDAASPHEVFDITMKYEDISAKTCIICGKPATKKAIGWISPYCDNCIGNREYIDL